MRPQTKAQPLCGCCSQCLDRRFAVLAADLAAFDPRRALQGRSLPRRPRGPGRSDHGARLDPHGPGAGDDGAGRLRGPVRRRAGRRRGGLSGPTCVPGHVGRVPDVPPAWDGGRPSGQGRPQRDEPTTFSMPPFPPAHCWRRSCSPAWNPRRSRSATWLATRTSCSPMSEHPIFPLRLVFHPGRRSCSTHQGSGGVQRRPPWPWWESEAVPRSRMSRREAAARSAPVRSIGTAGRQQGQVRQHAKRCRDEFAEQYEVVEGVKPNRHILVHSKSPQGYRLDPEARFVER